ncbi:MAG: extracellular solute-binding protein [Candidatus Bathyarchaeia archaeon]
MGKIALSRNMYIAIGLLIIILVGILAYYYYYLPTTQHEEKTKIKIRWLFHWTSPIAQSYFQGIFNNFTKEYPNIEIEPITVAGGELRTKFQTLHAAGQDPECFHISVELLQEFVDAGMLDPAPDWIVEDIVANYPPQVVEAVTYKGRVWGYPTESGISAMIYNRWILQKAGISEPDPGGWTLEDWGNMMKELKESGVCLWSGVYSLNDLAWPFWNYLIADQGMWVSSDFKKVLWNTTVGIEIVRKLWEFYNVDQTVTMLSNAEIASAAAKGDIATIFLAAWLKSSIQPALSDNPDRAREIFNANFSLCAFKGNLGSVVFHNCWFFGVGAGAQNKTAAWLFAKYMNSPKDYLGGASPIGYYSGVVNAVPTSRKSDREWLMAYSKEREPYIAKVVELVSKYGVPMTYFKGHSQIRAIFNARIQECLMDTTGFKREYIDKAVEEANQVLAQYYP